MKNYEIRVFPKIADDGSTYWTACYPSVPGCIGGGDTVEEAISDAKENLEVYLESLEEECKKIPEEDYRSEYSGKIALRVSKSTHKRIAEISENEGISINLLLNNAIENYIGLKSYDLGINKKIDELRKVADSGLDLQKYNFAINQNVWKDMEEIKDFVREGVVYE